MIMKTKTLLIISGLVLVAAVAAGTVIGMSLTAKPNRAVLLSTIFLTAEDNEKTIALKQGDHINLTLQDFGDGGYVWVITSLDTTLLQQNDYFTWGRSGMLGDFGKDTWTFSAIGSGSCTLGLQAVRSWDQSDISQTIIIQLVIS